MPRYDATVERDGKFWLIRVAGVGATQARHLREVDEMASDLVETMTGTTPTAIDLEIKLPASVRRHLDRSEKLRSSAADAQSEAAHELRTAARELADTYGLSLRDVGKALGVSHQRAHQLVESG